jgi:uncharacterized repeat protein (TIGR01451 family)
MTARPRFRRRLAAAVLPLLTLATAGVLDAHAADNNQNNADLAITKTAEPATVVGGGRVTYTLTVTNNGPRPGTRIRIHDELPAQVGFLSAEVTRNSTPSDSCSHTGNVVDCTIHGNVRPDGSDSVVITIVATVNTGLSQATRICNTATVSGNHDDPDPSNNTVDPNSANDSSQACVLVGAAPAQNADLKLTKTADKTRVSIGATITYTLQVHNDGPGQAANPTVTDVLPSHVRYVSVSPVSAGGTPPTCGQSDGVVSCSLGPIASGADAAPITIKVVATDDAGGSTLQNCATVIAVEDVSHGNDTGCADIDVRARADLSIVKTANRATALIGEPLVYTLKVENSGPNTATGVVVTDTVPSKATLTGVTTTQGSCDHTVVCTLGDIASRGEATVTITVRPNAKGLVDNTATVKGNEEDPNAADNTSTVHGTAYVALTGSAYGESVDVKTIIGVRVQSGPLASVSLPAGGGGPFGDSAVSVRVTNGLFSDILRLDALTGTTQGGRSGDDLYVKSSADVTKVSLANGLITVDALHTECLSSTGAGSASSANVANLRIAGVLVNVAAGPNSTITVPGVGQLILNEQGSAGAGLNQSRFVNGLHLKLKGLLAQGDVILAHSDCGIDP